MDTDNVDHVDGEEITVVNPDHVTEIQLTGDGRIFLREFCDLHLQAPFRSQRKVTEEVRPRLLDRADGVKGHFCIGRSPDGRYYEFWHEQTGWCSAGTVFVGEEAAEAKLAELS